jgi:hypothetical protein
MSTDDIVWQHSSGQVHYWPMQNGHRTGGINIHTPVSLLLNGRALAFEAVQDRG